MIGSLKAIHIYNSHEPTLHPKIVKKYVLLTHEMTEGWKKASVQHAI